jgi:threonine/homoserine/homoserine lactone efflux protein
MIEILLPYIAYSAALFIAAAIPGPGIAAVVGRALGTNTRATMPFIAGLALGDITYLTIAILGLSIIAKTFADIFFIIKITGGLYLLFIAWTFWNEKINAQDIKKKGRQSILMTLLGGFTMTMGNPKPMIFYLAMVPNVIDLTAITFLSWFFLSFITIIILFLALTPYVLLTTRAKKLLSTPRALKTVNRIAGTIIAAAGIFILGEAAWTARS